MIEVTNDNFEKDVLKNEKLSIVKYYSAYCNPCRVVDKVLLEIKDDKIIDANFFKVDIEEEIDLINDYNIMIIPTVCVFYKGKESFRIERIFKKDKLIKQINEIL